MSLRPPDKLHRGILHTTCDVVGGYESDDLHLNIAFPQMGDEGDDIFKRHGTFYCSYTMDTTEEIGELRLRRSPHRLGRLLADLLCLRYGKRVEFLGYIYSGGHFMQPRSVQYPVPSLKGNLHPFVSNRPRVDYPQVVRDNQDSFNLAAAELIAWIIENPQPPESEALTACLNSVHFYAEALRTFREHPDYAYLSLVTAGEVFTGAVTPDIDAHLDDDARALLEKIEAGCDAKTANQVRKKLYATTARFVGALIGTLDDGFFERTESQFGMKVLMGRIKKDTIHDALRAAYVVRSRLSHAGKRPSPWIQPNQLTEMPMGTPYLPGEVDEWARALSMCLTHLGLERVIRYALLKTLLWLRPVPPGALPLAPPSPATPPAAPPLRAP
jgi:hypothetical protein